MGHLVLDYQKTRVLWDFFLFILESLGFMPALVRESLSRWKGFCFFSKDN